jgi:hypothetical protein
MDSDRYEDKILTVLSQKRVIGTIFVEDGRLVGSTEAMQDLVDRYSARGMSIPEVFAALDGWSNGYWSVVTGDRFYG